MEFLNIWVSRSEDIELFFFKHPKVQHLGEFSAFSKKSEKKKDKKKGGKLNKKKKKKKHTRFNKKIGYICNPIFFFNSIFGDGSVPEGNTTFFFVAYTLNQGFSIIFPEGPWRAKESLRSDTYCPNKHGFHYYFETDQGPNTETPQDSAHELPFENLWSKFYLSGIYTYGPFHRKWNFLLKTEFRSGYIQCIFLSYAIIKLSITVKILVWYHWFSYVCIN